MSKAVLKKGTVYLVGAGPGDPGLLTLKSAKLLAEADVIIYDRLVNPDLLEWNHRAKKIYAGKQGDERVNGNRDIEQEMTNRLMVEWARAGKHVVRLKGGDPFIYGRGGEEASYLRSRKIPFEVVPGVSAGFAVPAYAGIPVTDRRYASTVTFITGHEDFHKKHIAVNWKHLAKLGGTIVSFMGVKNLPAIMRALMREGLPPTTKVSVIESGTLPIQRVVQGNLRSIVRFVKQKRIKAPALTVIGGVNALRKQIAWFEQRPLYGKTVLITRSRSQASGLKRVLEDRGAHVLEYPAIRILPPLDFKGLDQAIASIAKYDWIVFTSVNGVEAVFNRLLELGKDARSFSQVKIAAIGEATEEALRSRGLHVDLMPERFTSESLMEKLQETNKIHGYSFLLPRTDKAPRYLREKLEALGANVTEIVAYRTVEARRDRAKLCHWLREETIDYILFTSSSTVENFFKAAGKLSNKKGTARCVSIGPVTSQTLRDFGVKPYREAHDHTISGLVEVLCHEK